MIGVSIAWQRSIEWILTSLLVLNPQVWMDWTWQNTEIPGYLPMVFYMKSSAWNDVGITKAQEVGGLWLLGNEPEMQLSAVSPQEAAAFSREWQDKVGGRWAAPGIILYETGYAWLEEYLDAGGLVGEYWHVHLYYVNTPDEWEAKWNEFKLWMEENDLVKPVIISETQGWGSNVDQKEILNRIREIQLEDQLLYIVIWYSDVDWWETSFWANLLNDDGSLNELGEHFVSLGHLSNDFLPLVINE